ncbi:MAG: FtsW/RodA/SpoVE family cell cycle protein [Verrucomicrobiales bacterium]|nr:FtsW/RodA/SpoVE family cell cycle protein [Verrucomicrobiales bacterium]
MTPLFRKLLSINWLLVMILAVLLVFGVHSIHAATDHLGGDNLAGKWNKQIISIGLGLILFFAATLIDYRWIRLGALPMYILSIILLLSTNHGGDKVGAESWLRIGPVSFQPSQLALVSGILLIAVILAELPKIHKIFESSFIRLCIAGITAAIPCLIILAEPDLGSAMVWIAVLMFMLVIGRILLRYIIVIVEVGLIALPILYFFGLKDYQKERIETWLNMLYERPVDELGAAWVPKHNLIAIGSAGYSGKAINSTEDFSLTSPQNSNSKMVTKMGFIPKNVAINDFIFVTIAERYGFRGATFLIGLFAATLLLLLYMGYRARDSLGKLIIAGCIAQLFFHVFMNIGMCVLLVPITGLPLPFISYGGTFVLMMLFMMGMCQSVWVHRHHSTTEQSEPTLQQDDLPLMQEAVSRI